MKVTADDVAQLLASSPPRQVSAPIARAVAGGRTKWFFPLFGLAFGGFGMVFVVVFFPWRILDEWRLGTDNAQITRGVITSVKATGMSINDTRVMEYSFNYNTGDGRTRESHSFTTGQQWPANATVSVRYLPTKPDLACIDGARLSQSGWGGAFVLIFPLIGGGLVIWYGLNRRNTRRLLHEGLVTEVDIISVERTNTQVNDQNVYKIVITSPVAPGALPITVRRVNPRDIALAQKYLSEKQPVFILYDPRNPRRVIFPEALIDG